MLPVGRWLAWTTVITSGRTTAMATTRAATTTIVAPPSKRSRTSKEPCPRTLSSDDGTSSTHEQRASPDGHDGSPGPAAAAPHSAGKTARVTLPPLFHLNSTSTDKEFADTVSAVSKRLQHGDVVGLPTDTIYGVACLAQLTEAVKRIYSIKGRNSTKPIAICVAETSELSTYADVTVPPAVLQELLPGPVTLVFKRSPQLNPELNPETDTIGIRIPDNKFIRGLAKSCGTALALTSANRSGQQSSIEVSTHARCFTHFHFVAVYLPSDVPLPASLVLEEK
eukprot:m.49943 g.49943  ORF g.49943 m.49943 type:complete len:281 (-) comp7183_c0_seq2:314-1156(-)